VVDTEIINYQGHKLTLTGAQTENAPVTEVAWDVQTGTSTLTFGITEMLAPQDLLEVQRNLRARKVTWWSYEERASNRIGGEGKPSASGDTVAGYHHPQTLFETGVGGAGDGSGPCPFGRIIDHEGGKAIEGGYVSCGDINAHIDPMVLDLETDGAWLLYLEIPTEIELDDAGELPTGGILTSSRTTWAIDKIAWTTGTDYPDTDEPTISTGLGTCIAPLGKLVIEDGVATYLATGCGNVRVVYCDNLTFERP
jgi:hypothetical protein